LRGSLFVCLIACLFVAVALALALAFAVAVGVGWCLLFVECCILFDVYVLVVDCCALH